MAWCFGVASEGLQVISLHYIHLLKLAKLAIRKHDKNKAQLLAELTTTGGTNTIIPSQKKRASTPPPYLA